MEHHSGASYAVRLIDWRQANCYDVFYISSKSVELLRLSRHVSSAAPGNSSAPGFPSAVNPETRP